MEGVFLITLQGPPATCPPHAVERRRYVPFVSQYADYLSYSRVRRNFYCRLVMFICLGGRNQSKGPHLLHYSKGLQWWVRKELHLQRLVRQRFYRAVRPTGIRLLPIAPENARKMVEPVGLAPTP